MDGYSRRRRKGRRRARRLNARERLLCEREAREWQLVRDQMPHGNADQTNEAHPHHDGNRDASDE